MRTQEIYVSVRDSEPLYTGRSGDALSLIYLVLGGLAALLIFVAFQVAGLLYAGLWLGMGLMFASSILIVRSQMGAVTMRTVRAASVGPLRFLPPRRIAISYLITATCGLFAGTCAVVGIFTFAEGFHQHSGRRTPGTIFILSLAWLIQMAWGLRRPAGLELSPSGIRGVRGARNVSASWDEITIASAHITPKRALVFLYFKDGHYVSVDATYLGSDPSVVVAAIRHFLWNPADRDLLSNPREALRAVENASEIGE